MARNNVWKTTFHSTFEMIKLQPIREQENNRKAFEGTSMEPTIPGEEGVCIPRANTRVLLVSHIPIPHQELGFALPVHRESRFESPVMHILTGSTRSLS